MNFNISDLHTIYESVTSTDLNNTDKITNDLDGKLEGNKTALNHYEPITGEVFAAMRKSAADPLNLKIAVSTKSPNECEVFVEAVEFMTFCEAYGKGINEAAEAIVNAYEGDIPGIGVEDINVVFPTDALNKNIIGGENLGNDTRNDWAMKLMCGCCRYGMKPRAGVDTATEDPV